MNRGIIELDVGVLQGLRKYPPCISFSLTSRYPYHSNDIK